MYWEYPEEWLERWKEGLTIKAEDFATCSTYKLTLDHLIIGFCAIEEIGTLYKIHHLWLHPDFIGKGYGKKLLNETIEKVVTQPQQIIVEADPVSC